MLIHSNEHSLQRRVLWRTTVGVLVVWLAAVVLVWVEAQHELDELLDAHLAQAAALLVVQQNAPPDDDEVSLDAPTLHKYAPRVAYQVFEHAQLRMHSPNVGHAPMAQHTQGFQTVTRDGGQAWRVFAAQANGGDVQIYVAEHVNSRDDILWAVLRGVLLPITLALPVFVLGLWWSVRVGLRPLQDVREALVKREPHALEPLQLNDLPHEVKPLVDALNDLLLRLADRMQTERRFTADAAHELRTPIAAIRAQAQVALGAVGQDEVRQQALQATLAGCDRATRLVTQLLTLARVEGAQTARAEPVHLHDVLQTVCADLTPDALRRHQTLSLSVSEELRVQGQTTLWEIVLRNLIDNALRYSPDGATVAVEAQALAQGRVEVTVADSGPGLSQDAMARLGQRFYRAEPSLDNAASGSGLGWSIVRQIAQRQQWTLSLARSQTLGGLQVKLTTGGQA